MTDVPDGGVAVVTGASAGIGRAVADAFAARGWSVALLARDRNRLDDASREIEAAGGRAAIYPVDVADADAVDAAADRIVADFGRIDVWVNNAMVTVFAPADEITPAEYRRVTEVTYLGQVHGTLAALRHMRPRDAGTIVQIGSALAYRSIPLQAAYCAAKAAVRGFTDSLRSELIHDGSGIRLTMVHLPAVNTPQFDWALSRMPRNAQPVPPIHQPEAVAARIIEAAIDAPRELWVGLPTIKAILGQMVAPGWLDRKLATDAWSGQMTDEPVSPDRPANMHETVGGPYGAHGRFDRRSRDRVGAASSEAIRTGLLFAGLGLAAGALAGVAALDRRTRRRRVERW
ncbi:MAG TPA: SDR family oxidoreductase [Methylomirabilota bacterium]|nr:SDR family oxidoreductase [Methylomirabilota bacterium]